jgi:hypothetical protein
LENKKTAPQRLMLSGLLGKRHSKKLLANSVF